MCDMLYDLVRESGLQVSEVAERLGISCSAVGQVLNRRFAPSLRTTEKMARVLGHSVVVLFVPTVSTAKLTERVREVTESVRDVVTAVPADFPPANPIPVEAGTPKSRGMLSLQKALLFALTGSAPCGLTLEELVPHVPRRPLRVAGMAEPRLSPEDPRGAAAQSCKACVRRGWMTRSQEGLYTITAAGREALVEHVARYSPRVWTEPSRSLTPGAPKR